MIAEMVSKGFSKKIPGTGNSFRVLLVYAKDKHLSLSLTSGDSEALHLLQPPNPLAILRQLKSELT